MTLPAPFLGLLLLAPGVVVQTPPAPPAPDLKAVGALVANGQLAAAERQLRRMLGQGGEPAARELLGLVLTRQGRLEEAEREFQQALLADPGRGETRQHLARLYLAQNREAPAVAELRRAAERGPLERELALKLAEVEQAQGRPQEAARQLRSVVERFASAQALLQLARLQAGQKDATSALDSLRRARALAPNSEEVLSAQAQVSLAAHAPVPAILALEPLTRMCAGVAQYHYLLGVALMQAGDVLAAVDPLERAERLEPNRVHTLVALGLALNGRKLHAQAKPYLLRSLELEPDNLEALAALAESEDGLGELAQAEAHAQRALQRASGHPTANLVMGMLLLKQERCVEARQSLERAVLADPASPKAHYQLSLALARLGDEAGAHKEVELYREKLKELEERVKQLRADTGLAGEAGLRP